VGSRSTAARTSADSSRRRRTARSGVRAAGGTAGQNSRVPLARLSWLVTVLGFVVAALLLLWNGYTGYSLVLLAVACAAAVNLR
jgi:hypothetical protein